MDELFNQLKAAAQSDLVLPFNFGEYEDVYVLVQEITADAAFCVVSEITGLEHPFVQEYLPELTDFDSGLLIIKVNVDDSSWEVRWIESAPD